MWRLANTHQQACRRDLTSLLSLAATSLKQTGAAARYRFPIGNSQGIFSLGIVVGAIRRTCIYMYKRVVNGRNDDQRQPTSTFSPPNMKVCLENRRGDRPSLRKLNSDVAFGPPPPPLAAMPYQVDLNCTTLHVQHSTCLRVLGTNNSVTGSISGWV